MSQIFSGPPGHLILAKLTQAANNPDSRVVWAKGCPRASLPGGAAAITSRNGAMVGRQKSHALGFFPSPGKTSQGRGTELGVLCRVLSPLVSKLIYLTGHRGVFTALPRLQHTHGSLIPPPDCINHGSQSSWLTKPGCPPAFISLLPTSGDKRRRDILQSTLVTVTAFGSSLIEQQNTAQKGLARL